MTRRRQTLYRTEIRHKRDRATDSVILQYVGRHLDFESYVYGYPDGTFFVASIDELSYPPPLIELANELCIDIDAIPDARPLREAMVEAMAAAAMVEAPELLAEMADPEMQWQPWDLRELERKHVIAEARMAELERIVAAEMRRRSDACIQVAPGVSRYVDALPPAAGYETQWGAPPKEDVRAATIPTPEGAEPTKESSRPEGGIPGIADLERVPEVAEAEVDEDVSPASQTVHKALQAVRAAREAELAQRLPGGARRRLRQFPPASYIAYGEAMDPRADLCAAMTDGRSMGRKGREVTIIDWDGEWPVVVRRYGKEGRTIYKVEDALRRAGVEVSDAA